LTRVIDGNGGVLGQNGLGGGEDGMQLWNRKGSWRVQNGIIRNCSTGFDVRKCDQIEFRNIKVEAGPHNFDEKWTRSWLLGYPRTPESGNGMVIIRNCHVENLGDPLTSYQTKNGDNGQLETRKPDSDYPFSLLVENTYLGGAPDSCWDVKGAPTANEPPMIAIFRNVTFGPAHRALRVHRRAKVYVENCVWLDGSNEKIWIDGPTAEVVVLP